MDEPPSSLLKSRIPRKTILVDQKLFTHDEESQIHNLHCPLQKGIVYYRRVGAIFEHNIHSSGKHEPRIIVPKHPSRLLAEIAFIPIKGNRVLLFAKYLAKTPRSYLVPHLHISIYEIRADNRVGPARWSFNGNVDGHCNINNLRLIKSTENALGISFRERFDNHWKLFDISTTETDASDKFPLIESGRIDTDLKLKSNSENGRTFVILSPDRHILLNGYLEEGPHNQTIDIHYSDSGSTNFSFVTRISIPTPQALGTATLHAELAFSADGSKFAMAMGCGRVSVWDIRSNAPLKTFMEVPKPDYNNQSVPFLSFSSGKLGKEALAFVERNIYSQLDIIHVIDATSFETEETFLLKLERVQKLRMFVGVQSLFFDPSGETLYAELAGTLYEWDLRKNKNGPEWWIGD